MEKVFIEEEKKYLFNFIKKEKLACIVEKVILWQLELLLYNYLKQNSREINLQEKQRQFINNLFLKLLIHHKRSGEYSEVILKEVAGIKSEVLGCE